jgi:hypothetical protein
MAYKLQARLASVISQTLNLDLGVLGRSRLTCVAVGLERLCDNNVERRILDCQGACQR